MRLRSLRLQNFKRFAELTVELRPFQLLVGPNNSGKSTILQACALLDFCYRACLEERNGERKLKNRTLSPDEFSVIPTASPRDLWFNRKLESKGKLVEISVGGEFDDGSNLDFGVTFSHNRFSIRAHQVSELTLDQSKFAVALIPGFTGFLPQEEKRTPAVQRHMKTHGQHGGIIRNILLDLKDAPNSWDHLIVILEKVFPEIQLRKPEFNEQVERYIQANYEELRESAHVGNQRSSTLDLFASGSGFHQFVQIFAGLLVEESTTVLLDEPDAHLHGKLQAELYRVLMDLTKEGRQIIAATHSSELIAAAEPNQIIAFGNGKPARLNVAPEMLSVVDRLGAVDNLSMVLIDAHRKLIVVENRSDETLIRLWLERVFRDDFGRIQRKLVFLHAHRRPTGDDVNLMLDAVLQAFRLKDPDMQVKAFVVADRDYRTDDQVTSESEKYSGPGFRRHRWQIWKRVEIENYHLIPTAIVRAVQEQILSQAGDLFADSAANLGSWIERTIEDEKDTVRNRFMDAISRDQPRLEPSTALAKATQYLDTRWAAQRFWLVDAKEHLFPSLRKKLQEDLKCNVSDAAIIRTTSDAEVPQEIKEFCAALRSFIEESHT